MSYGLNVVALQGRLTKDPMIKDVGDGRVANFSLAVSEGKDKCSFFEISAWNKNAEFAMTHLKKGNAIIVRGKLKQEQWKDKEGGNRSRVIVIADGFNFAESKKDSASSLPYEPTTVANEPESFPPFNELPDGIF